MALPTQYIADNLARGYNIQSIKAQLLASGYSIQEVNGAIDYVSGSHSYGKVSAPSFSGNSSNYILLTGIIFAALLLIGGGIYLTYGKSNGEPTVTPDIPVKESPTTPEQPTEPAHASTGTQTGDDEVPVDQTPDEPVPVEITKPVTVPVSESLSEPKTRREIDEYVNTIASTQPQEALSWCNKILTTSGQFTCYLTVAEKSRDPSICEKITDQKAKDSCYVNFPLKGLGDASICQKIIDPLRQHACVQSYELQAISAVPVAEVPQPQPIELPQTEPSDGSFLFADEPAEQQ